MAHTRTYPHCASIQIEAGEARGYNKSSVTGKTDRFVAAAKTRLNSDGPPILNSSEKYLDSVEAQLNTIYASPLGRTLLTALQGSSKRFVIIYPPVATAIHLKHAGISPGTTVSGGDNRWRAPYGQETRANQLAIFQAAYQQARAANYTDQNMADAINAAIAATNAATTEGSRQEPVTADRINSLMTGAQPLPEKDSIEFRYLMYVLERYLPTGTGSGSRIRFDPWNKLTGTSQRPPAVGLYHELVHAWHNATGQRIFSDDDLENEMMTVGIAPFDQIPLGGGERAQTENRFRPLMQSLPARNQV